MNSAHKSTTKFYSLEKQAMKQNLPVLNPYVSIGRLELGTLLTLPIINQTPHTKPPEMGKKLEQNVNVLRNQNLQKN